jgi:hypothetical protein
MKILTERKPPKTKTYTLSFRVPYPLYERLRRITEECKKVDKSFPWRELLVKDLERYVRKAESELAEYTKMHTPQNTTVDTKR